MKTKDIANIALSIALISVSAQISIPILIIPFTLQVFALTLISYRSTTKQAYLSIITYIILGLIGFPVFAGARGGLGMLLVPSFAFIIGFIPFVVILSTYKKPIQAYISLYITALTILIIFTSFPLKTLIFSFWLPFIISDSLSIYLGAKIAVKLEESVHSYI